MTLKEALIAELDDVEVKAETIEKTLIDHSAAPNNNYDGSVEQKKLIDLCVIDCLYRILSRVDVAEGDYSIKQASREKIEARLLYLATQYGVEYVLAVLAPVKTVSVIRDLSNYW